MTVNYEANEENNEPIAPKTSIVGAHRVAQNIPFQSHLIDSLDLCSEARNQFTTLFRKASISLEGNRQAAVLAELSKHALSNFKTLQFENMDFNARFIENNLLVKELSASLRESLKEIFSSGFFGLVEGIVIPENLVALSKEVTWERFIDLVYEDGIPLYAIPRSDTVHQKFWSDRSGSNGIIHHEKGDEVPESFAEMGVGESLIFTTLWNSHI